jgi:DNA-binding MarR family transcriptional regulator
MPDDFPQLQVMQQLGRTYRALFAAFSAQIGQPMPRWRIMLLLHQRGQMSQKALSCVLRMDPASLTRQIKDIEKRGWVVRGNDAQDNRLTNVRLTRAGREVVDEAMPRRRAFIESVMSDLSVDQLASLASLLDTLETRLRSS